MSGELDFVARDTRVKRLDRAFRWPGGRHVAVILNLAYEAWSDGKAPGVGPMGNPLPAGAFDTNALSWGHYGVARGIDRLLRKLDRHQARASVMTSGVLAERTPAVLKRMVDAGHEIVAHSWAQDVIPATLTLEQVKSDIDRTTQAIESVSGKRPVGWISPRGTPSRDGSRLLIDAGYLWQGDVFDDERPYIQTCENGRIVAIPLTMEINDLPHAMRFGRSPRDFVTLFDDLLANVLAAEEESVIIDVTAHCHVFGRPNGAWAYEAIVKTVMGRDDVHVATREEIADYVLKTSG
ncbi:polysaccharide deacetylase family protein [Rhodoplanes sp. TEM]|uniref:Chitooligosaccharide deacetylase n=1 Tax=Rhodoplanes tepidamans TaxID=200616 RepID=A0ABT5J682_RHOTP|nr:MULTISPECIES: polysaccharide deacetylase family protein [Rhodoplanes]MDC7784942.1 polysaccharide deacetylase family protein [Rhodoplanes tepidamans]MDC7983962.1 polysaccharide deacetylase family protein [Rhodoplanes sp. TEM]MDQ0353829.1 peptidoglycan/xylan/chitin deacetylase (PgdA/CDA1 family) [Rhodoplanes tepidamans]